MGGPTKTKPNHTTPPTTPKEANGPGETASGRTEGGAGRRKKKNKLKKFFPYTTFFLFTHVALSYLHVTILFLFAVNDQVMVRWTARGQHRGEATVSDASGQMITFHGLAKLRIADGKIVAFEGFSDLADTLATS